MKTLKLFAALVLSTVLLLSVGCQSEGENGVVEPQPEDEPCFKFEILERAKTPVTFRVAPTAEDVPYVLMMVDKAIFDAFESVEAITYDAATVSVVPSAASAKYFVNLFNEQQLAAFGEGEEAYVNHLVALRVVSPLCESRRGP